MNNSIENNDENPQIQPEFDDSTKQEKPSVSAAGLIDFLKALKKEKLERIESQIFQKKLKNKRNKRKIVRKSKAINSKKRK